MAIHSCRVVEATKKHQKSQYLNVLNHETEKERKYVVFASNNIIQGQNMTSEIIKRMFDACYQAKRTREMLPPLPEGVRSSFIQYLDTIQSLEGQGVQVKVSDISDAMELPRPGVTRTVKEMEEKGYLKKMASEADGRVTYIAVTRKGTNLSQKYDEQYFKSLLPYMEEISDEDAECMIRTIEKFYQIMCERRKHYDER